jgi:MATE family multidrug resistance protein
MTLTRFPQGSFRELLSISLPLMLSSLSVMSMIFVDRLLLAHYSTEAMNAAVNATTFGWSLIGPWMVMASISEVLWLSIMELALKKNSESLSGK